MTELSRNLNIQTLTPHKGSGGLAKILITVIFMAYSEKLSDIIVLEKFELYSTKKANIAFALA